jgi:putative transposase
MVTAGTYGKIHYFNTADRLELLDRNLHRISHEFGWELQAWAVFPNHYHFVGWSPEKPQSLSKLAGKLNTLTAKEMNQLDGTPGRKVWHQYWETRLTFEHSYLARLRYVHQNPVHHRITTDATAYRWCSAATFEAEADPAFQRTVASMPIDQLSVLDDF